MKIAFTGEVVEATCECHFGEFAVLVYLVDPSTGRHLIFETSFKTEDEAADSLDSIILRESEKVLIKLGLKKADANEIEVFHGDDAEKSEQKHINEGSVNLH